MVTPQWEQLADFEPLYESVHQKGDAPRCELFEGIRYSKVKKKGINRPDGHGYEYGKDDETLCGHETPLVSAVSFLVTHSIGRFIFY